MLRTDVKNYEWRLNPVWHRMLYSCTHMATVGVNGLIDIEDWCIRHSIQTWTSPFHCIHHKVVSWSVHLSDCDTMQALAECTGRMSDANPSTWHHEWQETDWLGLGGYGANEEGKYLRRQQHCQPIVMSSHACRHRTDDKCTPPAHSTRATSADAHAHCHTAAPAGAL